MRKAMTALALVMLLTGCGGGGGGSGTPTPSPTPSPPPPPPPPPPPATSLNYTPAPAAQATTGLTLPLGKCINLSNMLEAPNEGEWGRAFQDADATRIAQAGFKTVRLPVRFSAHALAGAPYTIDPAFMTRVRHVLETNLAAGLNVILDLHHYEELFVNPAGHRDRLEALWRQIAAEFKDAPDNVWFELVNEPNGALNDSNLLATLTPALEAVRETNPTRPVIWGGQNWSGVPSLATVQYPNDPNLVPTIHYYDPFSFTHQGAPWISPVQPTGRVFGSAADKTELDNNLERVENFMAATGRVPFVGEYGAYEGISLDQRVLYYKTISAAFASIGVQSCAWGYTNTMYFWQDGQGWIQQLVDGVSTTTTLPPMP